MLKNWLMLISVLSIVFHSMQEAKRYLQVLGMIWLGATIKKSTKSRAISRKGRRKLAMNILWNRVMSLSFIDQVVGS